MTGGLELNDLLEKQGIDIARVLVLRHRPYEPALNKILPWLIAERRDLFDAFQSSHGKALESAMAKMVGNGYLASFIRHGAGSALFVGLYRIAGAKPVKFEQWWREPAHIELREYGMVGLRKEEQRARCVMFDLVPTDFVTEWSGKLIVGWPPPERSWWRYADRNTFRVQSILEESALDAQLPEWYEIDLSWAELKVIPWRLRERLSQWRAIYYIFDKSDGKGYVGSAYGEQNLLARWENYAQTGHGGNQLLRKRKRENLQFSVLQRVSPDMDPTEVIQLESTWKNRLHTRAPTGLNDN